nr:hypothetical protein CFP56_13172 [Quercus suber]
MSSDTDSYSAGSSHGVGEQYLTACGTTDVMYFKAEPAVVISAKVSRVEGGRGERPLVKVASKHACRILSTAHGANVRMHNQEDAVDPCR